MQHSEYQNLLNVIKRHNPKFETNKVEVFENGYDHYVLLINNKYAFRFRRPGDHGLKDDEVAKFSQKFAALSPVPIQKFSPHIDPDTGIKYQTYEFIPGISLTKELASSLKKEELLVIAKDLGKFLTVLHAFPVKEAKAMNIESLISVRDYGEYFRAVIEKDKRLIRHFLTDAEWDWVVGHLMGFYELTRTHDFNFTLTHSDLLAAHILVDENTHRLSGIIDFGPRIADPANDFKQFDIYGEEFLSTVYDNYPPVDKYFDKRRQFYANDLPVANLYLSVERNDDLDIQQKFAQILKDHITTHP